MIARHLSHGDGLNLVSVIGRGQRLGSPRIGPDQDDRWGDDVRAMRRELAALWPWLAPGGAADGDADGNNDRRADVPWLPEKRR